MINPIDLEIYWNRLISIADEAGAVLKRTSFSTVVRESNDFACVLLDAQARLIAQSSLSIPGFIGTAPLTLKGMLKAIPIEQLVPGDVLFTNDPWIGTGHLPDASMARPIFHQHRVIAFAMSVAHLSDIGGRQWSADANELFEEGIRFPVLKLVEAGTLNAFVVQLLMGNVRLPEQVKGDLFAQLAALSVSEQRLLELVEAYKLDDIDGVAEAIFNASEKAALAELAKVKPGIYKGYVDSDGFDEPIHIQASVDVSADGITIDYTGSSQQVRYGINETYNHTYAYSIFPLKCLLAPAIPNNDGFTRLFKVHAPEGSIVNARFPAPVGARHLIGHQLQAAVFDALATVFPTQVQADSGTPLWSVLLRGLDTESIKGFSSILFFNGGMGAMQGRDGPAAAGFPANISNTPVEVAETLAPILFGEKRLADGSGGAGCYRGGDGQIVSFQSRWPGKMRVSLLTDRTKLPARGLCGGKDGKTGGVYLNGKSIDQPKRVIDVNEDDWLELRLPGGGGFG
ncbi:MAG: hydantoinase B/oxoprolinase family protein [Betaproteobacteria bacterium]|jgi:N-methylhydantoinase B|nr:hydantoinase B/oxoprolinase family protein [Pseudomonadota bacterium]NBP34933.1 hydantoinase B/oxoprolinase family protein [Betaproteobacteria bacterium]NBP39538.1 hydantoinase B/oxoprolinase family protein [Betaproteobacteria bacterium]NBS39345.1 hydantoinase B/oxoprolinase family protein [Betaproteobacteria bacterium]NBT81626.1 hydantoinase B/oxoprolinase family protein [Betaproteobacteria bacterium]